MSATTSTEPRSVGRLLARESEWMMFLILFPQFLMRKLRFGYESSLELRGREGVQYFSDGLAFLLIHRRCLSGDRQLQK